MSRYDYQYDHAAEPMEPDPGQTIEHAIGDVIIAFEELPGAPDYTDRSIDLPVRFHIPATSRHPLPGQPAASMRKSCPAANQPLHGGAKQ